MFNVKFHVYEHIWVSYNQRYIWVSIASASLGHIQVDIRISMVYWVTYNNSIWIDLELRSGDLEGMSFRNLICEIIFNSGLRM